MADAGSGLVGWRHLAPVCDLCAAGRPIMTLREFVARLDGRVRIDTDQEGVAQPGIYSVPLQATGEPPYAVLAAEIALLHARLDDLQGRLEG